MILIDTHIWVWWVEENPRLTPTHRAYVQAHEAVGLGVSVISCWEIAKLVHAGRLAPPIPIADWMEQALSYPGIRLLELTPRIAIASTQLPGTFHRDPADQIIVATARVLDLVLVTADQKILDYAHVRTVKPQDAQ